MALVLADRVKETTTTTGTSDFALGGAVASFQTFSAGVGANNTTYYSIADSTNWEVGLGTLSNDGLTLARTTVLQSSNADAKVSFAAGSKEVFVTYPGDKAVTDVTSTDGSVAITTTNSVKDLSVSVSGSTTNIIVLVRNTTGSTLTKGTAVYISGATGQNPTVSKALATSDSTSAQTLGLMTADLANNTNGYVTVIGLISNINTSAYTDGAQLYLSGSTAGTLTATKPYAPTHLVYVAVVEHAHATQGKLFVKVQNGYEMEELHDVSAQSPTTGQTLVYNSSTSLWEKNTVSLTAGVNGTLPVANGGTGITSFGTGIATFLGTPSSANLASALTDETGTGALVFANSPTLVTPAIGTPSSGNLVNCTFPTLNQSTTGSAASLSATLIVSSGGTGQTTYTNGQLLIGNSTGNTLTKAALTAGTGISITNGAGSITIANTASASAATPTALGTVYGATASASPNSTLLGYQAGTSTTGVNNTVVGFQALLTNSTGTSTTAIGYQAGYTNNASANVYVGVRAGYSNTTGTSNTFVGGSNASFVGYANTTGSQNTALGTDALASNTTASGNTAVGYQAAYANTTGSGVTALGYQALYSNTTGTNVALGYQCLYTNSTGNFNIAIAPYSALYYNTTGNQNNAVGHQALQSNTTASYNNAFGYRALYQNTTGAGNSAFGDSALYTNTTGSQNTAFGYGSLAVNSTGGNNTAVGYEAGYFTTGASGVTAFGFQALRANTSGTENDAFGNVSLKANTTGGYNSVFGTVAMFSNTTGSNNVAVGNRALYANTTASNNTALGYQAGYGITTGGGNTCIGQGTGNYAGSGGAILTTGYNNTYLGNYACASASNSYGEMVISASGNGTQPVGKGSHTGFIYCGGGGVYQGNNSSSWSTTSDQRLKKNIVDNNTGLEKITQIQVRNFEYRLPEEITELYASNAIQKSGVQLGVIAQELQAVLPECVKQESTGVLSVDTDNLTWYLINAVKELSARVKQLEGN